MHRARLRDPATILLGSCDHSILDTRDEFPFSRHLRFNDAFRRPRTCQTGCVDRDAIVSVNILGRDFSSFRCFLVLDIDLSSHLHLGQWEILKFKCQTRVSRDMLESHSVECKSHQRQTTAEEYNYQRRKSDRGKLRAILVTKLFGGTSIYLCRQVANSEYEIAARRDDETSIRQVRPAKFHRNLFTTGKSIISVRNKNSLARTSFSNHV